MKTDANTILSDIRDNIKKELAKYSLPENRLPEIIAVSKTFPENNILPFLKAGHRIFGENKVQEARQKWPELKRQFPGVELHLVGPLQTNKVRDAIEIFDVIESVDREKLARALAKEQEKGAKLPTLLIQVNSGEEEQKSGVYPNQADELISLSINELNLPVKGLMCIPPWGQEPSPHFALLKKIADRNNLHVLSMGMSRDYEIAASLGATHVRIGAAIFGKRK